MHDAIRSALRRLWMRSHVRRNYINARRYKAPIGHNGREVWAADCEQCGEVGRIGKGGTIHVDHKTPVGPAPGSKNATKDTTWDGVIQRMLYVTEKDLQLLCVRCHSVKTKKDKARKKLAAPLAQRAATSKRRKK